MATVLLPALPALARVELPRGSATEQGGTPARGQATPCTCGLFVLPAIPFGMPGLAEAELLARWTALPRIAIAAERARWRAVRVARRPRPGQTPPSLRPRTRH